MRLLVEHRWPFRLHATYDESIGRFLNVFERINAEVPFAGLRWFFDHAETITDRNLERVRALGAASPCSIAWLTRGNTLSIATEPRPRLVRRRSAGCCRWVSGGAGTDASAWPVTIRGFRCIGSCPEKRSEARRCTPRPTGWIAWKPFAGTRWNFARL